MKPAVAKVMDANALEDVGRATLQIVHDLKNQLNGLKLYATFLRRRLEHEDRPAEERETLAKLIAGLDRAASDMTTLVHYARPLELRHQRHVDLRKIISTVAAEAAARHTGSLRRAAIVPDFGAGSFVGEFDPAALSEALKAITVDVVTSVSAKEANGLSIHMRDEASGTIRQAVIEWRGGKVIARSHEFRSSYGCGTLRTALAARIIEAHGGRLKCDADVIRAWLPLSANNKLS